jgi:polysaccharide deacetylase family protein (PEP-CTERM system associated)
MLNALSIDLEDWFHAELVRPHAGDAPERRVEQAVQPMLALLDRFGVRATFFVVGDVVRHHPELVRRIYQAGHEIGCHGWSHRPLWALGPEGFAAELAEFDRDIAGVVPLDEIIGFRAPTFSLDGRTAWGIDLLRRHGFRYDSSIFPVRNYLYGVDGAPDGPYCPTSAELTTDHAAGGLIEFPMTACRVAGLRVPVSGGFYLRAFPLAVLRRLLARVNASGQPIVLYVHPWEGDAGTPRLKQLSPMTRFITYYNLAGTLKKLEALLQGFNLAPLRDVLQLQDARRMPCP